MNRIEDLFEPLPGNEPAPPAPTPLDEATERYGFDATYAALLRIAGDAEKQEDR